VDYPFAAGRGAKVRPAVVVQNDRDNGRTTNTVVAMITSRTHRSNQPTQVLIEIATPDGQQTGLVTLEQTKVLRKLGRLTPTLWGQVAGALKATFDLP
jgi:mRNA-degrading endonuclease toxin of MazEF toxin-antitoxin module